jgi:hypothetical protein
VLLESSGSLRHISREIRVALLRSSNFSIYACGDFAYFKKLNDQDGFFPLDDAREVCDIGYGSFRLTPDS